MIKVYGASKLAEAPIWILLRTEWPEVHWTARWPVYHVGPDIPEEYYLNKIFWMHDDEDVRAADVVLLYGTPEVHLRGGLVEAGIAIGAGKQVIVVGNHPDYGTWQFHPVVHRARHLSEARDMLRYMAQRLPIENEP